MEKKFKLEKKYFIKDLSKILTMSNNTEIVLKITSINFKKTSQNSDYIDLELVDKTGRINAKSFSIDTFSYFSEKGIKEGDIIKVSIELQKEFSSFKILDLKQIKLETETDDFEIYEYKNKVQEFYKNIPLEIKNINTPILQELTKKIFESRKETFLTAPYSEEILPFEGGAVCFSDFLIKKVKSDMTMFEENINFDLILSSAICSNLFKGNFYNIEKEKVIQKDSSILLDSTSSENIELMEMSKTIFIELKNKEEKVLDGKIKEINSSIDKWKKTLDDLKEEERDVSRPFTVSKIKEEEEIIALLKEGFEQKNQENIKLIEQFIHINTCKNYFFTKDKNKFPKTKEAWIFACNIQDLIQKFEYFDEFNSVISFDNNNSAFSSKFNSYLFKG